jgi:integrase
LRRVFQTALKNLWAKDWKIPERRNSGGKGERRLYFTQEEYKKLYRFMRAWCETGRKARR